MKLFLIGWDGVGGDLAEVAHGLKMRGHQILYWTRVIDAFKVDQSKFPGTIFHDIYSALAAKPALGIDDSKFAPPDEKLLAGLYETESMVLTMMGKKFDYMNVNERKHLYYDLVRYWYGVINQLGPEMIIFPVAPHTVYDYVIYGLAKFLNLRIFMFDTPWVGDRLLTMHDFKIGSTAFHNVFAENRGKRFRIEDLSPESKEYFLRHTAPGADAVPLYMKNLARDYSRINVAKKKLELIWASIADLSIFSKVWMYVYKIFQGNARDEYISLQGEPDFKEKFVYVALHYQPEQTTAPLGGIFVDQILMIETLAAVLPEGWKLYVKEHPTQWKPRGFNYFSYRYRNYYRKIAGIKNVKMVPVSTDTFSLINNSQAVATVTGTAAIEAVFRGKSGLVFGYPWFAHMPGIMKVRDVVSVRDAFLKITRKEINVTREDLLNFFVSFDRVSFNGYLDEYGRQISKIGSAQNVSRILNVLVLEIEAKNIPFQA